MRINQNKTMKRYRIQCVISYLLRGPYITFRTESLKRFLISIKNHYIFTSTCFIYPLFAFVTFFLNSSFANELKWMLSECWMFVLSLWRRTPCTPLKCPPACRRWMMIMSIIKRSINFRSPLKCLFCSFKWCQNIKNVPCTVYLRVRDEQWSAVYSGGYLSVFQTFLWSKCCQNGN